MVVALFIAIMYIGQGFAFGQYQIRIATALYALGYLFPFLVLPLALANGLSNTLFGGLGIFDIVGGFGAGILIVGAIALLGKFKLPKFLVIIPLVIGLGLLVPLWLSPLLGLPYWPLALSVSIGQITPGVVGYILIQALSKRKVVDQ